jgi:hypothetical protein
MIEVRITGFQGAYAHLNTPHRILPLSRLALAHAVALVGKAHWFEAVNKVASAQQAISLGLETLANVETCAQGLRLSAHFHHLDASERRVTTYRLGMGLAKVVMERELRVPWLMHVDRLVAQGRARLAKGAKTRPDLAGPDIQGDWHVTEAKGRSGLPTANELATAKAQATRLTDINGVQPSTRCVSIATLGQEPFRVHLHDPDGDE